MCKEAALTFSAAFLANNPKLFLHPIGDAVHTIALRGLIIGDEIGGIRWLIGVGAIVDIKPGNAVFGIEFIAYGWINRVEQNPRARDTASLKYYGVSRQQIRGLDADRLAGRRIANRGVLGLRLVEGGERSTTAPAKEH